MNSAVKDLAVQLMELHLQAAMEYGINLPARKLQIVGEIDENMVCHVDAVVSLFESQGKATINVLLNSTGGGVYDGIAIATRLKHSKCPINIEAHGAVMSAATVILAAGDKRSMSKYCNVMIHETFSAVEGRTKTLKSEIDQMQREEQQYCALLADFTGTDHETWTKILEKGTDYYLTAEQSLELGLVSEIF